MINAEKYRSQILEFIDKEKTMYFSFKNDNANMLNRCCESNCNYCVLCPGDSPNDTCAIARIKWLLSEYREPIKLTRLEYDVLKYLSDNTTHRYIIRDNYRNIYLFDKKPKKSGGIWYGNGAHSMAVFNKLFQFVQREDKEPTSIQEALRNCEVEYDR